MKWLIAAIFAAATLWGGYWVVGSRGLENAMIQWIDDRRVEGWQADYSSLEVQGFPNRFDTTVTEIALADPGTGWAWRAPFFQMLSLSYKPTHVVLVWPESQMIQTPHQRINIEGNKLRGSVRLAPSPALPLESGTLVFDEIAMQSDAGWRMMAKQLRLGLRTEAEPEVLRIGVHGLDIRLPAILSAGRMTSDALAQLEIDATLTFTDPWDRYAVERARPQPTHIKLTKAFGTWGEFRFLLAGALAIDPLGSPKGELVLKLDNWREVLQGAGAAGLVPQSALPSLTRALDLASRMSGSAKSLDLPLKFASGRVWIGPVPVGKAPVVRLR